MSITKATEYNLVIIGAGAAGFTAAYEAANQGLTKILLVEKGRHTGGSGDYIEGAFAVNSKLQQEKNVDIKPEEVVSEELDYSHYEADVKTWQQYVAASGEMIDWLGDLGAEYIDVKPLGSGKRTWHLFKGLGKEVLHGVFEPKVQELGVEIITSVSAQSLKKDDNGRITGVVLESESDHSTTEIATKAVIIATGGYLNNKELIDKETGYDSERLIPVNSGKNTGDGLKLAWEAGARKYRMGMAMLFGGYLKDPLTPSFVYRYSQLNGTAAEQSLLWVNESGQRFVNEEVVDNFAYAGNALFTQGRTFSIIDQNAIDHLMNDGLQRPMSTWHTDLTKLTDLQQNLDEALEKGLPYIHKADTLEELAEMIETPDLVNTVRKYNTFADQGVDQDFGKQDKYLLKVDKAPYYALELGVGAFCTMGGLKVNLKNEVIDTKGQAIPGLYAAGNDAAGNLIGDTYGPNMPGTEAGYSFYSGKHSADCALEYLKKV
ncbi:FAD-dependent oxidoreductase [Xylocopilactobacillus apicola]|uniref:Fumarate reductase n=1 Tax=Xylocopilactobacillus apicola TaxID=2932184 RepID=A0AAU9D935_9LACO|nr:FAD-binding protein [Xylocopilactobacillus apicola]BDR58865.1 fumarate reductase [Xylocopilactobacillus apicola]